MRFAYSSLDHKVSVSLSDGSGFIDSSFFFNSLIRMPTMMLDTIWVPIEMGVMWAVEWFVGALCAVMESLAAHVEASTAAEALV